jgi:alkanesulfonate monooxygenase SsuD/methylene tetrahydromethanopterin reductase-like flavin-dependent oxidoreductase (luciferase family)
VSAPPRVSVIIPHAMRFSAADLTAFARHAEGAGLDGVFVGDHLTPAVPVPDSTLALAAAAAVTSRVRLGFGVMVLGARVPGSALDAHIAALAGGYRIPADIARELPLHGSPAAVAERLCSYAEAGAQHIVLGLISDDWRQQCDLLAEAVRLT